ncbi:YhcN/YlaJ family sporulation lipoprotein [Paramaledivibacter caminithermalis]|uniref:Sporulation lipoprotein, YhcN/YlaJ family n=1 Tax=Paramaledivibacter caminithermalis (strain DSM 15212 / CIP 107654 / DViRD3) TaxID=1121301 RepID=A0A1M6R2W7_PARC5|nr:YhcN/YlaJ family sporulation lipoprotein [Paramaledivibacter caminithermalis]SHK26794.1 sporulation lipoprotein, YhcN/YlaJ family [Paramaledivibacter caminithermalis DSM 15212]
MTNDKLRIFTIALSLVLIISAFIVGCTPQQRPVPERYGTKYYMNDNRYYTGYDTRNPYNYGQGNYRDNRMYNYGQGYTPDNRLYGFFDIGDNRRGFGYDNIPQGIMNPTRTSTNSAEVNRMENSCENIRGVTDATVVRDGDTCYVGINKTKGTNENVAALRTECANRIRQIDPSVKKVVVTVDPNKITKLKNMVRDINMGRPARSFLNDLQNLFR